ncbi:MAG: hypothetical protein NTY07_11715 [Bacteroidia bacterium]|nr:hypothetical protein [Bacteroidia bacterium]
MGWLANIFKSKTKDWFYSQLAVENTPDIEVKILNPNEEYLSVILKSMRIVNVRKGLAKFYATVHSHIEIAHLSGKSASFNYVTTPGNLEKLDGTRIDRVVNLNRRLLGPVPYRGGDVKMEVGLFSIKEADLAAPFIDLLSGMSSLGGVSFISTALPYVKPLEDGIALLTGSGDDTILEIGINQELDKVKTGYFVVMRADKNEIDATNLVIDKEDFRLVDKDGNAIQDYPYMVFEISSLKNRDDWFNIPDVSATYNRLQEEVQKGNYNDASEALKVFKRIVYTSPDLLLKDGKAIYEKVDTEIKDILQAMQTSTDKKFRLKNLSEYSLQ